MVRLRVVNRSDTQPCHLVFEARRPSPVGSLWFNVETVEEAIAPGATGEFYGFPVGDYDLHAQDCEARTVARQVAVPVYADFDRVVESSRAGELVPLEVVNGTQREICTVYLDRTGVGFRTDRVQTRLAPGHRQPLEVPVRPYDLWLAGAAGTSSGSPSGKSCLGVRSG
jgi:hypothetical protein